MALPLCVYRHGLPLQAQLVEWEAAEAHKCAVARDVALRLKADRAAQLADRDLVSARLHAWQGLLV